MIKIDISEDFAGSAVAREVVDVSLFLNDGRFPDLLGGSKPGAPLSTYNYVAASMFLGSVVLANVDPKSLWEPWAGYVTHAEGKLRFSRHFESGDTRGASFHAFVLNSDLSIMADVTADQFGLPAAILKPLIEAPDYEHSQLLYEYDFPREDQLDLGMPRRKCMVE